MEKRVVIVKRELVNYKCNVCNKMVDVSRAIEKTIETDTSIIHAWDYGHYHRRVFEVIGEKQITLEDTVAYD